MIQNEDVYDVSTNAELSYLMLLILMALWDEKEFNFILSDLDIS